MYCEKIQLWKKVSKFTPKIVLWDPPGAYPRVEHHKMFIKSAAERHRLCRGSSGSRLSGRISIRLHRHDLARQDHIRRKLQRLGRLGVDSTKLFTAIIYLLFTDYKHSSLLCFSASDGDKKVLYYWLRGPNVKIFLCTSNTNVRNKLECLFLGSLSNLV
jgi:hypothetical protein